MLAPAALQVSSYGPLAWDTGVHQVINVPPTPYSSRSLEPWALGRFLGLSLSLPALYDLAEDTHTGL